MPNMTSRHREKIFLASHRKAFQRGLQNFVYFFFRVEFDSVLLVEVQDSVNLSKDYTINTLYFLFSTSQNLVD